MSARQSKSQNARSARRAPGHGEGEKAVTQTRTESGASTSRSAASGDPGGVASARGFGAFLDSAAQEIVAATYWFDPAPQPKPYRVTIRFTGHRIGSGNNTRPEDQFARDETVEVIPGSGPVSVTARVSGVSPGEWAVRAKAVNPSHEHRRSQKLTSIRPITGPLYPAAWSWRTWSLSPGPAAPVRTRLRPFVRVPGLIPGGWAVLSVLGIAIALATQALLVTRDSLRVDHAFTISLIAIAAGAVGAKTWYAVLQRRTRRMNGWCIQGLLVGVLLALAASVPVAHTPLGVFLDASAPGLLLGMALGRVGCLFGGCCCGRPTPSRWGIWSSDQRVGTRRYPTQLLEAGLAAALGAAALATVLVAGPANGGIFVAALAAYTLGRQGVLRLRAERRKTLIGPRLTAITAAVILTAAVLLPLVV
ncbi:MAG: diacylglyceryl transferase [Streptosporangiales bacterium]|nr:diacylglyceryl transferase [Streptosporangiales bacterium]